MGALIRPVPGVSILMVDELGFRVSSEFTSRVIADIFLLSKFKV